MLAPGEMVWYESARLVHGRFAFVFLCICILLYFFNNIDDNMYFVQGLYNVHGRRNSMIWWQPWKKIEELTQKMSLFSAIYYSILLIFVVIILSCWWTLRDLPKKMSFFSNVLFYLELWGTPSKEISSSNLLFHLVGELWGTSPKEIFLFWEIYYSIFLMNFAHGLACH